LSTPNSVTKLYCPNCGTGNLETNRICRNCDAVLPKRYLWGVGAGVDLLPTGTAIGHRDRFFIKAPGLFLDTQPGVQSAETASISPVALPYLRLFAYRLHIPQVYAIIAHADVEVILLEQAPLTVRDFSLDRSKTEEPTAGDVPGMAMPLAKAWQRAGLVRQLNWLWQIAQLWQPFALEGVATSLLQPELLRVEGPLLRLRQLTQDHEIQASLQLNPQLSTLGRLWKRWLPETQVALQPGLSTLCNQLIEGSVTSIELVILQLEQWFDLAAKGLDGAALPLRYNLATRTDQGPSRKRNEDACYPSSGTLTQNVTEALTIVCDGVGGHAGGDVASSSAIETIQSLLPKNSQLAAANPHQLEEQISVAIYEANNLICQKNDAEHRQERQRMGTTVVLTLARHHQVHIAHVGDSRVYWVNRHGCYLMTLDDDVACREVRLGYTLYRDVLQHPIAGSLVQALGMSGSENLHPNVTRWMLDEDCVFLLCSDGLSDYDRVEEFWRQELLPLLSGETDLVSTCDRLVEVANTYNGHDNVTVSLLHCQVDSQALVAKTKMSQTTQPLPQPLPATILQSLQVAKTVTPEMSSTFNAAASTTTGATSHPTQEERSLLAPSEPEQRERSPIFTVLILGLLAAILGALAFFLKDQMRLVEDQMRNLPNPFRASPSPTPSASPIPSPSGTGAPTTSPSPGTTAPDPTAPTAPEPNDNNQSGPSNPPASESAPPASPPAEGSDSGQRNR
jgi:protein phosphatase